MAAIRSTAAEITTSDDRFTLGREKNKAPPDTTMAAPITAIPPPCGVGSLCEERAFGSAMA
jgi:hypothetical protein